MRETREMRERELAAMKRFVVEPFEARLAGGKVVRVCCGPRLLRLPGLLGYRPVGEAKLGRCCHKAPR